MSRPDESRLAEWADLVGASVPDAEDGDGAPSDRANPGKRPN